MGYTAFFHILVYKDGIRFTPWENEEIENEDLYQDLNDMEFVNKSTEDVFYDLMDYHEGKVEDEIKKISIKYPDYVFVIREFPIEHDEIQFTFFQNGKRACKRVDVETPRINENGVTF